MAGICVVQVPIIDPFLLCKSFHRSLSTFAFPSFSYLHLFYLCIFYLFCMCPCYFSSIFSVLVVIARCLCFLLHYFLRFIGTPVIAESLEGPALLREVVHSRAVKMIRREIWPRERVAWQAKDCLSLPPLPSK